MDMDRLIKNQLASTQTLEYIKMDIERRFKNSVIELIELMQEGVGYVAFNDESGFPTVSLADDIYNVVGVMVKNKNDIKSLYIYTNKDDIENLDNLESDGWFCWTFNMNYSELFDCLISIVKKDE